VPVALLLLLLCPTASVLLQACQGSCSVGSVVAIAPQGESVSDPIFCLPSSRHRRQWRQPGKAFSEGHFNFFQFFNKNTEKKSK
jgi:hypothetical protein